MVKLLETTLIRVGNKEYARQNNSFGLTTLRDQHVDVDGSTLRFEFRGKSGKEHSVEVQDRRLARIVRQCRDLPGQKLSFSQPIALRMVSQLGLGLPEGITISGIGGIENSHDAIEFMLLGASTVQICTGVMLQGVKMVDELQDGLAKFMTDKGFNSVQEIVGKSLPYFSTHMDLVSRMKEAKRHKAGEAARDNEWAQKDITEKTAELTSN